MWKCLLFSGALFDLYRLCDKLHKQLLCRNQVYLRCHLRLWLLWAPIPLNLSRDLCGGWFRCNGRVLWEFGSLFLWADLYWEYLYRWWTLV